MKPISFHDAPKPQFRSSIVIFFVAVILLAPFYYVAALAVANLLPVADANSVKEFVNTFMKSIGGSVGAGTPIALYARSLLLTYFQGTVQTASAASPQGSQTS